MADQRHLTTHLCERTEKTTAALQGNDDDVRAAKPPSCLTCPRLLAGDCVGRIAATRDTKDR
jgi:hypothetical protein